VAKKPSRQAKSPAKSHSNPPSSEPKALNSASSRTSNAVERPRSSVARNPEANSAKTSPTTGVAKVRAADVAKGTAAKADASKARPGPAAPPSSAAPSEIAPVAKPQAKDESIAPARKVAKTSTAGKDKAAKEPALINGNGHTNGKHAAQPQPRPFVVEPSVLSDEKPRKNRAGLHQRDLEIFRTLLLEKRRELLGDVSSMERDALGSTSGSNLSNLPLHMADMGTDNYEQEFTLGLMEKDRRLLKEIYHALAKIQNGSYGICEGTGQPITKVRLEAQPWARFSIEHARKVERTGGRLMFRDMAD
jgi:DnaK suppressor protein